VCLFTIIPMAHLRRLAIALLAGTLLAGCAAERYHRESERQFSQGRTTAGLETLREAIRLDPGNVQYRLEYAKRLNDEIKRTTRRAETLRENGDMAGARAAYASVLGFDSTSERARRGISELDMDTRHATVLAVAEKLLAAGKLEAAREQTTIVRRENPANARAPDLMRRIGQESDARRRAQEAALAAQSILKKPVTLQFRDANVRMVFEALSRTTGLNVVFDRDVRSDLKTTIFVRDGSVEDTVSLILLQNQLEKKVLNANTLFIYPATPAKEKEYQELKVQTFRVSNGDAKYIQGMLKSVLKIKEVQVDERTNTLVLRDTPESLSVASKVIAAHDQPDAEVMLEVEVLEVSRDRLTNIGIKWPESFGVATPVDANGNLTWGELRNLNRDQLLVTPLQITANFKLQDTDANILASPRIRVRDREKAKILIGDKVPIITNAVTPVATGAAVVTGSIQYIDVGIKLEAEPHVYDEGDVGIKLNLEVSNIVREITGAGGSLAYQIGTRMASTHLRLRDGETQVLGGLINDSDRNTAAKVPGVGQLPILGHLFSNNAGDNAKTEIVLSITPRIVRAKGIAEDSMADAWSGTDTHISERPLRLDPVASVRSGVENAVAGSANRAESAMPASLAKPSATSQPEGQALPGGITSSNAASALRAPGKTPPDGDAAMPTQDGLAADDKRTTAIVAATGNASVQPRAVEAATASDTPEIAWGMPVSAKKGDQFTVIVNASRFNGIDSVPLAIQYDPQVLTFVDASLGEFGTRTGAIVSDPVTNQNAGRLNMTLKPGKGDAFTGSGELMRLTFSAKLARAATQLSLARVDLREGSAVRTIPRPQPLTLKVDP
jgi:general secretion pathway protein D